MQLPHKPGDPDLLLRRALQAKIRDYLLGAEHPVGRYKATFFRRLSYERGLWRQLGEDLQTVVQAADAMPLEKNRYGQKYLVRAILKGPNGETAGVHSIWLVPSENAPPHLITAYPGEHP